MTPITKRPCANCPFRKDADAIELRPGRLEGIVSDLMADDRNTFICHKTLDAERKTCGGAVGFLAKAGKLPVIARMALALDLFSDADLQACKDVVIDEEMLLTKGN